MRWMVIGMVVVVAGCGGDVGASATASNAAVPPLPESGSAGAPGVAAEPVPFDNGGWSEEPGCARLVGIYGPWPRPTQCPEGRIECDGSNVTACEIGHASDCADAMTSPVACVAGTWTDDASGATCADGCEWCRPVCAD